MKVLSFDKPILMGILNLTPDSFSDGGLFFGVQKALDRIEEMTREGADIIDIGAQSTAGPETLVGEEVEWERLEPVLSKIDYSKTMPNGRQACISVDTFRASVAEKALKLGVQMMNDVTALRGDPRMIDVLLKFKPYVCLMHSSYITPYAGNQEKHFENVMLTIKLFLKSQADKLLEKGFPREKIIVDPGMGRFLSNDPTVSFEVIERLAELKSLEFPILVGPSRKGFLWGEMKDRDERTLEVSRKCLENGANILRIHDVKSHRKLLCKQN